eukprot:10109031-Lingulodinium_polyedra.AAC.1
MVDFLSDKLHLLFRNGKLELDGGLARHATLFEEVTTTLLHLWKFQSFCESRWCTIGTSCRTMVVAQLSGVHSLAAAVLADPSVSKSYLGGCERLTPTHQEFIAMAAICSYPAEG